MRKIKILFMLALAFATLSFAGASFLTDIVNAISWKSPISAKKNIIYKSVAVSSDNATGNVAACLGCSGYNIFDSIVNNSGYLYLHTGNVNDYVSSSSTDAVIYKYFNSGSKYSNFWETQPDMDDINVVYLTSGTNMSSFSVQNNTIYVMENGRYYTTNSIALGGKQNVVFVGEGLVSIYYYNTAPVATQLSQVFSVFDSATGIVIDNITCNGNDNIYTITTGAQTRSIFKSVLYSNDSLKDVYINVHAKNMDQYGVYIDSINGIEANNIVIDGSSFDSVTNAIFLRGTGLNLSNLFIKSNVIKNNTAGITRNLGDTGYVEFGNIFQDNTTDIQ